MALFDLPLSELQSYKPPRDEPPDWSTFWQETLQQTRAYPLKAQFAPADFGLRTLEAYDVTFSGYGGQPVKGWFMRPRGAEGRLPCVVEFIGYGGGRGFPYDWLAWPSAGFAYLVMDTRGQGSVWRPGDTPDPEAAGPQVPGFMTRGVLDPQTYYYRRVFADGVRAVEAARSQAGVDPDRVAVTGASQGGGIALAVAGLEPAVAVTMPDVPFLCHYRRAIELIDTHPYAEITVYLHVHRDQADRVLRTLSYFDGVNFGAHCRAQALFSVGLMDDVCPPSTVYAAYNHYAGPKDIRVYPFNKHEGGESFHLREKVRFLQRLWET